MGELLTLHYNSFKFEMFTVASSGTDYSTILIKKIFIKKMFAVICLSLTLSLIRLYTARLLGSITAEKLKFSIKDFLRKCDQIRKELHSRSHLPWNYNTNNTNRNNM